MALSQMNAAITYRFSIKPLPSRRVVRRGIWSIVPRFVVVKNLERSLMAGHHQYNALIPFDEFRMKASAMSDNSARNYKKAITSFESFVNRTCRCQPVLSENILTDWFIDMSLQGLSMKTMSHYLDIIAALYKDTQASSCDAVVRGLSIFKQKIKTFGLPDLPAFF